MKKVNSIPSIQISSSPSLNIEPTQRSNYCSDSVNESCELSPVEYVRSILPREAHRKRNRPTAIWKAHQKEELENYDMESVRAIRDNDLVTLRALLAKGKSMNACNRNGETLLHLACRRGNLNTVKFLVQEACVDVNVQDDMGRSVLHDVCWRPHADTSMMEILLEAVNPDMLLAEDCRGHCCFNYCRKEHWNQWIEFFCAHAQTLKRRSKLVDAVCASFKN